MFPSREGNIKAGGCFSKGNCCGYIKAGQGFFCPFCHWSVSGRKGKSQNMRVVMLVALALAIALAVLVRRGDSASLRRLPLPEDDEDFRPLYRGYGLVRRSARADDAFDDYGHLRFGRSDD